MLDKASLKILLESLEKLDAGFAALPEFDARIPGAQGVAETLAAAAERLQDNYPYFHPLYAGQMLKPPHPVARLAYALAQWINPNNHALDGGRATSFAASACCTLRDFWRTSALTWLFVLLRLIFAASRFT